MRLAVVAAQGTAAPGLGDAGPYLYAAGEITRGRYPDRTEPYFFRAPGYPFFLAAVTGGRADGAVARAKAANALLGAAAAPLLAALSLRIFGRRDLVLATGLAAAVFPSLVFQSVAVSSEPLFLVLLLASGLALLAAADAGRPRSAAAAGALLGLAALTRPSALALAPLLLAPALDRRRPRRAGMRIGGIALVAFLATLAPWTLRNALRYHELIPVSDAGGVSLYAGNSSWTRSYYALRTREEYDRWFEDFSRDLRARLERVEEAGATSPGARSRAFARMAIAEAVANPGESLRLLSVKAWHWVRPYPTPWFWPRPFVVALGALYVVLYALAARGLWRSRRRGVSAFCLAVLGMSMAVHVLLQVVWRYRVPYWDPILLLFAVPGARR